MNKIFEFDPVIYPRILWVVKGTKGYIKENFRKKGGEEFDDLDFSLADGWTCKVEHKEDNCIGVLIWMSGSLSPSGVAHECWHAVTAYVSEINADIPD